MATKKNESTGLHKLLEDQLADLYYVEKQLLKALPKMAKKATDEELVGAFEGHLEETQGQVERIEQMFELIGKPAKGKKCPAIDGILEEGNEMMAEFADDAALDAALVAAAQKVEHYEIASYGSMKAWATQLEMTDMVELIEATLEEEKEADEKLSTIGESVVNITAEEDQEEEEEGELAEVGSGGKSKTSTKAKTTKSR